MTKRDADVIVIGSGPAGVSAALPLVEAGRSVLMLDGAGPADMTGANSRWARALGGDLESLQPDDGLSPKLRTPIARETVGAFRDALRPVEHDFYAIGSRSRGGLARIWGCFVAELDDTDMTSWPFRFDTLRPSYAAVTKRIGISGSSDDDTASFFGTSSVPMAAPPIGPVATALLDAYQRRRPMGDFSLGLARNALLTTDMPGRLACDLSLGCLWGCPRHALYDAQADLAALRMSPKFMLRDHTFVTGLQQDDTGWQVTVQGEERPLRAPRIVAAAGTFGSLKLLLPLVAEGGNGRLPLQNSPVLATPLLLPRRIGSKAATQGFHLAQLGYRLTFPDTGGSYVTGGLYEVASLPPSSFAARLPLGRRAATEIFRALAPAMLVATTYFPGSLSANEIRWRRTGGDYLIEINGGVKPEMDRISRQVRQRLKAVWRQLGAVVLPGGSFATPGTDAHTGAVFPMGGRERHGTDEFGELRVAPGIHVVDGSVLPSISSKFTTLTIMANADRIGRHVAAMP